MDPESRSVSVTEADVADALLILGVIVGWLLPADQWDEVDRQVTALTAAFAAGDGGMMRLETERLELLSPERGPAGDVSAPAAVRANVRGSIEILDQVVPVRIYLSDGRHHELVESAVDRYLGSLGLSVIGREDPVAGSWSRKMLATVRSLVAHDPVAASVALGINARYLEQQNAANTTLYMQNLGPLLASLQPTKDAVVRVGAFLVVKVDWTLVVTQLTPRQQLTLDHSPQLATTPQEILHILGLPAKSGQEFLLDNPGD